MSMIYADKTQTRFFLLTAADAEQLTPGGFEIASLTGSKRQVDEQAVSRFELPETAAKKYVGEKLGAVQQVLGEISSSVTRLLTDSAELMEPKGRFMTLLSSVEVRFEELQRDTAGTVAALRERLLGMDLEKLKALVAK